LEIQHLFFDLDNTLWDFRKNSEITLEIMYEREKIKDQYNVDFHTFHNEYFHINENLWAMFRDNKIDKNELRNRRFFDSFSVVGIENKELAEFFESNYLDEVINYNHLVEGVEQVLDYLHSKYHLHILSNGFMNVTHRKIESSNLNGKFKTITSAEEINKRKPDSEVFHYSLEKAKALPENSAFIGDDWIAAVLGAKAVGFNKVVFLNTLQEKHFLKDVIIIDKMNELDSIF